MDYTPPKEEINGWWFSKILPDGTYVAHGPYPDELSCHYALQRIRREDIAMQQTGLQQNLIESGGWRATVRDIFGPNSIEAYPPRGSRG